MAETSGVWIVADVGYEHYCVRGVFTDEDEAKVYLERYKPCTHDHVVLEFYPTDQPIRALMGAYEVCMASDGRVTEEQWVDFTTPEGSEGWEYGHGHFWRGGESEDGDVLRVVGIDREEAVARGHAMLRARPSQEDETP